ncbi:hypothetical protein HMPREF9211_1144 [Lactobacillus iners LactinV 01V1-a]|uniref:Uncharacterized protein n=1 Tax=Lactobacillus iners LactinV 01V1-a TaxID=879297 RepID=E1NTT6_9LACO|nr:hypothetical protein HMPREF9211_1144 [Lactobacillus iners LactinV 01V1-a]
MGFYIVRQNNKNYFHKKSIYQKMIDAFTMQSFNSFKKISIYYLD